MRDTVIRGLRSCATEQDIVQVLYADLHPAFGYDTVNLQVLEREGWYHSLAVQRGVLQDTRRQQLARTSLGELYEQGRTSVLDVEAGGGMDALWIPPPGTGRRPRRGEGRGRRASPGGGPGGVPTRLAIWVPVYRLGRPLGAVAYQLERRRAVPDEELAVLEEIHGTLAVVLAQADSNALTRNQPLRLSALNAIGRQLSTTLDEPGLVVALRDALAQFLPVDRLELSLLEGEDRGQARVLAAEAAGRAPSRTACGLRARRLAGVRAVLTHGETVLGDRPGQPSLVAVPVLEQGVVRGALAITSSRPHSYEHSTVAFLEQVAHQVGLALRNTWTYAALEAQRRRLEVVNSIGRRLTSSLDRWSIMRTLREELARYVDFDMFALATLEQTDAGPVAAGFVYDSGLERPIEAVPLELAGPSREAYETGRPVLIRRSPWATSLEHGRAPAEERVVGDEALLVVTRPGEHRRVAARSLVWVPVRQGDRTVALLSLQSYRREAFDEWHVQLLEDVGAHVSLALANARHFATAQTERRRLEALHALDRRVAAAADERQVAEAFFAAARWFMDADGFLVAYLDSSDRLGGWRAVGD
ncbi:MAG: GAF domain-containing protein, partial [Candidatus Dormibacteraeota bacterium]|nr:GAF domain-containing protein [Candidatus Dormibacteraeota bacterium]MBO0762498.1 GAF domain-containing protein [Candidatus Dormibacteraeota bacterium]